MNHLSLALALSLGATLPALAETSTFGKPKLAEPTSTADAPAPVAAAEPAGPANIMASDPAGIADALQSFGYKAVLDKDGNGDPKILSGAAGSNFSIYFYGCAEGKDCSSIQISAGFDLTNGTTADVMNDWNSKKRYGKAYVDQDGDPWIEMDINLEYGGITAETFRDNLDLWERLVADFKTQINW